MSSLSWSEFLDVWIPTFASKVKAANQALWILETTGSKDAAEVKAHLDLQVKLLLSNPKDYDLLLNFEATQQAKSPWEKRQLEILICLFKENQIAPDLLQKITFKEVQIAQEFVSFRPKIGGEKVSENDVRELFRKEREVSLRKQAWEVSKEIGARLAPKIQELVLYRNEAAQNLGYPHFFSMQLALQEVEEKPLFTLLKEVASKSQASYEKLLQQIDTHLCEKFQVSSSQLGPWAWADPFAQEDPLDAPEVDHFLQKIDMPAAAKSFFLDMGFSEVGLLLENSDLYEREGKNSHAFCMNLDRKEDIRTLNNLRPTLRWMDTLLHELGHAVYEQGYDPQLPWLLRQPPHRIPTEAVALLCGRQAYLPEFLTNQGGLPLSETNALEESLKRKQLIFSRWVLVMSYFERDLYQNPNQNLNQLWWKYVEAFQGIRVQGREKAADWAAKYHIGLAPVYYFSYLLGELFASSLSKKIIEQAGSLRTAYTSQYLQEKLFVKGAALPWDQLIEFCLKKRLSYEDWLEEWGMKSSVISSMRRKTRPFTAGM